jgi:signal transduction histidine kinase
MAAAAVLAFVASDLRYERAHLLDDFAQTQQALVRQVGGDLQRELQDVDEEARLVAGLAHPTVMPAAQARAPLLAAFQALAAVVRHYRMVGLFGASGPLVVAPDPAESPETVRDLSRWSAHAAEEARQSGGPFLEGPHRVSGGRQVYLYARPVTDDEVIVLVWEARLLLQSVLRPRPDYIRYFVLDTASTIWIGCGAARACRGLSYREWSAVQGLSSFVDHLGSPSGTTWGADALAASLGLPRRSAVVAWNRFLGPDRRPWTMGAVVSATALESRERSLLRRLLMVSGALVLALGVVAAVVVGHLRRTAVLGERLRTAQQVAHLRERSEKLLESVPVGLIGLTGEGRVALVNRFLQERVGAVKIGLPLPDALPMAGRESMTTLERAVREASEGGRLRPRQGDQLFLAGPKGGHFEVRIIPLEQAAGEISALIMLEDFSEIRSLKRQLIRAEKLVTTGVLTAGLAHEIGTPLTIIRARADSLLERASDGPSRKELESVVAQIDHISATIRQVLDFSRAQPVELRAVETRPAVSAVLSLLDWRFRQKTLSVRVDAGEPLHRLAADADQLQQVLVNLLMNAVDASAKGQTIVVRISNDEAPLRRVKIEIIDTGCGIPGEHINAVFDPFFTTKKRGEGTGLGLPVAASIVRNHQGEIVLSSEAGVGTTVTVLWPAIGHKENRDV